MENQFKDKRLNEFLEAIKKFTDSYDAEKNKVSFFLIINEDHGEKSMAQGAVKGKPLHIMQAVECVINSNDILKKAYMSVLLGKLCNKSQEDKDDMDESLDILKRLAI